MNPFPMALAKKKLESFRTQLVTRRDALARDLSAATAELIDDEVTYTDSVDQAAADTDKTLALQIKDRSRDTLWQIEEALRRIEAGTYGQCERCDDPISDARLKAFPFTTLCIDCKAELESEGHRFPGRNS